MTNKSIQEIQKDLEEVTENLNEISKGSESRTSADNDGDGLVVTDIDDLGGGGGGKVATVSKANDPNASDILLVDEHLQDPFAMGHSEAKRRVEQADDARFMSRTEMKALVDEEDWSDRFNLLRDKDSNERTLRSH